MDDEGLIEIKFPNYNEIIDERRILEQKIKNRLNSLESILLDITFPDDTIEIQKGGHNYRILNLENNLVISQNSMQLAFKELSISNNIVEIKFLLDNADKIIKRFHENNQRILTLGKKIVE
ncbi:hypothetical protein [Methanobacterium sp.]|uniref:hypothetical protein n=1 Tax=Methanobacterium sp. TaxID=2164 RepID=UPI003C71EACF